MKRIIMAVLVLTCWTVARSQDGNTERDTIVELKAANEHIAQLEQRIKLMMLQFQQQQGMAQFYQAGLALCELDKQKTSRSSESDK